MVIKNYILALIIASLVACSFLFPSPAMAANLYYVSTSGSDLNPGTLTQPFRTIQKGVNRLVAGDTLYVRAGTYTERITVRASGSSTAPVTISSYPGETAILDGTGLDPGFDPWTHLIDVSGRYAVIQNLELTYPRGRGIWTMVAATHVTIRDNQVHDMNGPAFELWGNYALVENNKVWKTNRSNFPARSHGDWSAAISIGDQNPGSGNYAAYTTIRNNLVYENYGEGIMCTYTDNILIEGNTTWDNWAADIYLDQCSYSTIRNNLVYYTTNRQYWRNSGYPAAGIEFSNEGIITYPVGHDRKIYNNIIVNAGFGIFFWTGKLTGSALINDLIANNTIVNNYSYGFGIDLGPPNGTGAVHRNTIVANNLVSVLGTPLNGTEMAGISFSHNLWSQKPVSLGSGDIVGDPFLSDPSHNVDASIDPNWYVLTPDSPAIGKALTLPDVRTDYFGKGRDSTPNIGACETPSLPGAFEKVAPTSGILNQPPSLTLNWNASRNASSYEYCIALAADNGCNAAWISTGTNLAVTLSDLPPGTYYWQVRARNVAGIIYASGSSSSWWSFSISPLPGPFGKSDPTNGAPHQLSSPTLSWGNSGNALSYEYCLATSIQFACKDAWISTGPIPHVALNGLPPGRYYWQVRARNKEGTTYAEGDKAVWWSFIISP